jgi:hypothetical protein
MLTAEQVAEYERDGFLVLRGQIADADIKRLEQGYERCLPPVNTYQKLVYPEPGRYTVANNCLKDPDLAFIAEHAGIVPAAEQLLGDSARLTAFVLYDRTPGGGGLPPHNDYKRWRPVGSSMNWLFAIVPFCDYDADIGPLFVAPGSHRLERVCDSGERALHVDAAITPDDADFIDPGLRRGDLLLMNMHMWHRAAPNRSDRHRVGIFNKYAAANAPPATGYFLYDEDVYRALSPEGRRLLAVHSDKPISTTRIVLERSSKRGPEVFLIRSDTEQWCLPGGPTFVEQAIPDWDRGNVIAALQGHLRESLSIETPWVSYVGDFDEGPHLCRIYGYALSGLGFPVPYRGGEWFDAQRLANASADLEFGYEPQALAAWLDPAPIRGKGLSQAQSRVDQYAY